MATAGGSCRKSHGGKATRRSLMLPPCCSTPMPRVRLQPEARSCRVGTTPYLFQANVRVQLWNSKSRRVSSLKARDFALSTGTFCCGVYGAVSSRRIPRPLQKSTNILFEYSVPLSVQNARGIPMSATKRFTTERKAAALFSRTPYGRCRRDALSTNITT